MTPYAGIDPLPAPPVLTGKGQWSVGDAADDGDDRDAATAMVLAEAAIDRSNWMRHRAVNGLEDNATPYPADIAWDGTHLFKNSVIFENTVVISGPSGGFFFSVSRPSTFNGTAAFNANVTVALAATTTLNGPAVLGNTLSVAGAATLNGPVTHNARVAYNGDGAYRKLRKKETPTTTGTIQPWTADLWIVPPLAGDIELTLEHPPFDDVCETTIQISNISHTCRLKHPGGLEFEVLGNWAIPGVYGGVTMIFSGTNWRKKCRVGNTLISDP